MTRVGVHDVPLPESATAARYGVPSARPTDLYSAVYAVLDAAKSERTLVKLYRGSHASRDPHPVVSGFGEHFFRTRQGLLGYAVRNSAVPRLADLDEFDRIHRPRTSVRAAFEGLADALLRSDEDRVELLRRTARRQHALGAYRGGSSGHDDETKAFVRAHVARRGLRVRPADVMVFTGGFKGAYAAVCGALLCVRDFEELRPSGGRILAAQGHYQSLRLVPPLWAGALDIVEDLDGPTITAWLTGSAGSGRAVYVPVVNNADGRVLSRDRALGIAEAVLEWNAAHRDDPVVVIADDVYEGSVLDPGPEPLAIGAITGADLDRPDLGRMSDCTVTVVTPSKTTAFPTSRIAFSACTSPVLNAALAHYRTVLSHGRAPQVDELTAVAALCLTPQSWIDGWNQEFRTRLATVRDGIDAVNRDLGRGAFRLREPQGGWYALLEIAPDFFDTRPASSVDAFAVLLHYDLSKRESGIAALPGELFGYRRRVDDPYLLRCSLAVDAAQIREFLDRLADFARAVRGRGAEVERLARDRARQVADIDAIVRRLGR